MIQKVVKKMPIDANREIQDNLAYWLSRPAKERVDEVLRLRETYCGPAQRLQRVVRIIKLSQD